MSEKYYTIEKYIGVDCYEYCQPMYSNPVYRYKSLYNSATGAWYKNKDDAVKEGDAHEKIIISLTSKNPLLDELVETSLRRQIKDLIFKNKQLLEALKEIIKLDDAIPSGDKGVMMWRNTIDKARKAIAEAIQGEK